MATIKSYTDISQSKALAEILSLESADMYYTLEDFVDEDTGDIFSIEKVSLGRPSDKEIGCWSLAALLSVLPNDKHITTTLSRGGWKIEPVEYIDKWFCEYEDEVDENSPSKNFSVSADNPVDACVAMIEKLHELKML